MEIKKLFHSKQGSSIVEVIVSFFIVLITVIGFYKVILSTTELLRKSLDYSSQTQAFDAEFYKNTSANLEVSEFNGSSLSMKFDPEGVNVSIGLDRWEVKKMQDNTSGISRYTIEKKMDNTIPESEP